VLLVLTSTNGGKNMRQLRVLAMIILILFWAGFAGCGGGEGGEVKSTISSTTVGQELIDLESAYKNGAITEKEYERAKKKILERK